MDCFLQGGHRCFGMGTNAAEVKRASRGTVAHSFVNRPTYLSVLYVMILYFDRLVIC